MNPYNISNDYFEIIAGTTNKLHPVYMEATKNANTGNSKALGQIKNFITSIESLANKSKDSRISNTKGNIKNFAAYDNIKTSIEFLKKNLSGISTVNSLVNILKAVEDYQPQYTEGYEKNIRLVMLEYESAVEILVMGITLTIAEGIEVVENGTSIKIKKGKNGGDTSGVINKTVIDMAKQLNDKKHKIYLDELIKAREYVKVDTNIEESTTFTEATIEKSLELIELIFTNVGKISHYTINIVNTIKNSLFGIIPLIRCCLYLRYKKKADTVLALEQQADFIKQNIENLQNRTNMDPKEKEEIIKKQRATIEAYMKKAAKIRAELSDAEREASNEINKENPSMKNVDDEFLLENGINIRSYFSESK